MYRPGSTSGPNSEASTPQDRLGREPALRRLQRQLGRAVGRQRIGTPADPDRTDPERVVEGQDERRPPVGPAGQPAAGHGQHRRRDPEPTREELLVGLGRMAPVDAARADDRDPETAPSGTRAASRRPARRRPPRPRRTARGRRTGRPPPPPPRARPAPSTSPRPRRRAGPARSGRAGPRRRCGPRRRGREHPAAGSARARTAAAAAARRGGMAEAGSWCGRLRAARYHSSARASGPSGPPPGRRTRAPSPAARRPPPDRPAPPPGARGATAPRSHTRPVRGSMRPDRFRHARRCGPGPRASGRRRPRGPRRAERDRQRPARGRRAPVGTGVEDHGGPSAPAGREAATGRSPRRSRGCPARPRTAPGSWPMRGRGPPIQSPDSVPSSHAPATAGLRPENATVVIGCDETRDQEDWVPTADRAIPGPKSTPGPELACRAMVIVRHAILSPRGAIVSTAAVRRGGRRRSASARRRRRRGCR